MVSIGREPAGIFLIDANWTRGPCKTLKEWKVSGGRISLSDCCAAQAAKPSDEAASSGGCGVSLFLLSELRVLVACGICCSILPFVSNCGCLERGFSSPAQGSYPGIRWRSRPLVRYRDVRIQEALPAGFHARRPEFLLQFGGRSIGRLCFV